MTAARVSTLSKLIGSLGSLSPDSRLEDLPLQDFQVTPMTLGQVVAHQFQQRPELPGVIIADESKMWGMISRRRFNDWMSSPYSMDKLLESPIQTFLNLSQQQTQPLQLTGREKIDIAIEQALSRTAEDVYEPIVVIFKDPSLPSFQANFLLDFQMLILAQSQILARVNQGLVHQKVKLQQNLQKKQQDVQLSLQKIALEKRKIKAYNQLIKKNSKSPQTQLTSEEKTTASEQNSQEINQLNQRLIKIGKQISTEGKQTFQATFDGVNAICRNTNQIVEIGQLLNEELETLQETSQLVKKVSKQVWHLSVKAAIVANNEGGQEFSGFSQITNEISKLVSQTLEAGRQMDRDAHRFTQKIKEFTNSAHTGMQVARALIEKITQAESSLEELESLVASQTLEKSSQNSRSLKKQSSSSSGKNSEENEIQTLVHKLEAAESTLADLEALTKHKDSGFLVQKIRRALNQHKNQLVK